MRLLHHPPETPSLETWLGRDVPHEREMAGQLLDQLGREKSLTVLLNLHDREETKRLKQQRVLLRIMLSLLGGVCFLWLLVTPWLRLLSVAQGFILSNCLLAVLHVINIATIFGGYGKRFRASSRQQNIVTALFDYNDSPLIADLLCRALAYYHNKNNSWALFTHLAEALSLLPDEKDALTKQARLSLRNRLLTLEDKPPTGLAGEDEANRRRQADFEIAVLRYFARTRDRDALPAIRRLVKAETFSDDGKRVQDAARVALQAFSEPAA